MKMCTEPQRYSLNGETMGSSYTAVFYAEPGIDTDVNARIGELRRIVETGPVRRIYKSPAHPYTQQLRAAAA